MQAFNDYLDTHHEQFLAELSRYLRQPSIAAQNRGMLEMADLTRERLEARGFKVRLLPTGGQPVVYGELGEGPKTLLIYDHYDVQPPEPLALWETPAFEPTVRDGKLYAPTTRATRCAACRPSKPGWPRRAPCPAKSSG